MLDGCYLRRSITERLVDHKGHFHRNLVSHGENPPFAAAFPAASVTVEGWRLSGGFISS